MDLLKIKTEIESANFQKKWIQQSQLNEAVFKKEISFAIQHISKNPYLLKCTQTSILQAVMNIAHTGLTLNPVMKYAYLIPRKINTVLECVLDPSYMGLIKLLTDSGSVKSINAQIVWQGDKIEVDLTSHKKVISHFPYVFRGEAKGEMVGVYSLATLNDGSFHCEIMSIQDVDEIRDRSEAYKAYKANKISTTPWQTDKGEMSRKTVVKRQWKYLPKSNEDKFCKAIQLDNYANGYDEPIDMGLISVIEGMLLTSSLSHERREKIEGELLTLEHKSDGLELIKYLSENQADKGRDLANLTSQKEIIKATRRAEELDNK